MPKKKTAQQPDGAAPVVEPTVATPSRSAAEAPSAEAVAAPTAQTPVEAVDDDAIAKQDRPRGPGYRARVTNNAKGFEMGEDYRFRQHVFKFRDKPDADTLKALKDAGFTYRGAEKSWTIQASAATREIADRLAQQFAGEMEIGR